MPILDYIGKNKQNKEVSFRKDAGCFCILGKNGDILKSLQSAVTVKGMESIHTVRYYVPKHTSLEHNILDVMVEKFSFMRTMRSTAEQALTQGYVDFNVQDYSLNEVMHCMFFVRNAIVHVAPILTACVRRDQIKPKTFDILVREYGYTPEQAYSLCVCPQHAASCVRTNRFETGLFRSTVDGDERVYSFDRIPAKAFFGAVTHGLTVDDGYWVPGTLMENILNDVRYTQNISKFLTKPTNKMPMSKEWLKLFKSFRVQSDSKVKSYFGMFEQEEMRPSESDVNDALLSLIKSYPEWFDKNAKKAKNRVHVTAEGGINVGK
jgi:hypothetical protein